MQVYRIKSLVFYVVLAGFLIILMAHAQPSFIPDGLFTRVGHNSESFLFAILVGLEIQYIRPAIVGKSYKWPLTLLVGAALVACGFVLLNSNLPGTVVTLNEPVIASGLMLVYISFERPFRYWFLAATLILAFVIVFFQTDLVLGQAESLIPLFLAPFALDLFDRRILDADASNNDVLRVLWMALLIFVAVVMIYASGRVGTNPHGWLERGINYGQRAAEAYWGWLFIQAYFGYWLRNSWRSNTGNRPKVTA